MKLVLLVTITMIQVLIVSAQASPSKEDTVKWIESKVNKYNNSWTRKSRHRWSAVKFNIHDCIITTEMEFKDLSGKIPYKDIMNDSFKLSEFEELKITRAYPQNFYGYPSITLYFSAPTGQTGDIEDGHIYNATQFDYLFNYSHQEKNLGYCPQSDVQTTKTLHQNLT